MERNGENPVQRERKGRIRLYLQEQAYRGVIPRDAAGQIELPTSGEEIGVSTALSNITEVEKALGQMPMNC